MSEYKYEKYNDDLNIRIDPDGTKIYYNYDLNWHREDGPAIEYANGDKFWFKKGILHREDEPAIEFTNGDKYWYKEGNLHRLDGPAIEYASGDKSWYYNGKIIKCKSQEEFGKLLKLKIFW